MQLIKTFVYLYSAIKQNKKTNIMKTIDTYGVLLTKLENMRFSIYQNNSNLPAMNTISREERKEIVLKWLKEENKQLK